MRSETMTQQSLTFASSPFWPIAIGFFGLGTGYFIWGGQVLFGYPKTSPEVDRTMGMWGFWMPGFCQFLTGVYLMVGLTWFNVFGNAAPLYMAGVAFTVYGIHWFAMAHRRYIGSFGVQACDLPGFLELLSFSLRKRWRAALSADFA